MSVRAWLAWVVFILIDVVFGLALAAAGCLLVLGLLIRIADAL